ncbi:MAG: FadR family transcriptional regulator [Tissierellales bacterium]|nr:FadR family transcriptional regulator [Tissierellales bacterium]MBN2826364.1 FadR family transcriptional regulator [Tissierellales bacterium]
MSGLTEKTKDKKVHEKVIEYIDMQVNLGLLKKGDKIPPERQLVEILGIGRNSIREALKILNIIGLLEKRQGDGTYIRESFDEWFSEPMSIAFLLSENSRNEIFEFRNMVEVEIATLAAERITEAEIQALIACYNNMINVGDEIESARYDKLFHYILAKSSRNLIIISSYNAMSRMMDLFIHDIREEAFQNSGEDLVTIIHQEVFEAIIAKDPVKARQAMKHHMDVIRKFYK